MHLFSSRAAQVILPLLCLSFAGTHSPLPKNDLLELGLKGKVKTCITKIYHASGTAQNPVKGERMADDNELDGGSFLFNESGNILVHADYYGNGKLSQSDTSVYDKNGRLMMIRGWSGFSSTRLDYTYDKRGNRLSESFYYTGKLQDQWTYTYDKSGNKTEAKHLGADGSIGSVVKYTYGKQHELLKEIQYDDHQKIILHDSYRYDNGGRKIATDSYNLGTGEVVSTVTFTYNDAGQKTKEEFRYTDGSNTSSTEFTYDAQGNETSEISKNKNGVSGDKHEFVYEYDAQGNWTKKTLLDNGTAKQIMEREIVYY